MTTRVFGKIKYAGSDFYFCKRDDGSADVFVGSKALSKSGIVDLGVGDRISFDIVPSQKKQDRFEADNIELA